MNQVISQVNLLLAISQYIKISYNLLTHKKPTPVKCHNAISLYHALLRSNEARYSATSGVVFNW